MSTRAPIQVPEDLKNSIEGYKDEFHSKTSYEVIEKLIRSHEAGKRREVERREKAVEEATRQDREDIHAGEEVKKMFEDFRKEMKITSSQALELLLCHFSEQPNIGQVTFGLYRGFK